MLSRRVSFKYVIHVETDEMLRCGFVHKVFFQSGVCFKIYMYIIKTTVKKVDSICIISPHWI